MDTIRLAYRDNDRTPVIYCIKAMAERYYDLNVEVLRIADTQEYEAALFDGSCDMICEHQEYLFQEVAQRGRKVTTFLAPVLESDGALVAGPEISDLAQLRGKKIAVRTHGRPYAITLRLRALGLEDSVEMVLVADDEVGRWRQWTKVTSRECAATFVTCLYLPPALEAGLHVLPTPSFDVVGHFHHACTTDYARAHHDVMVRYVRAAVHAICLMKLRRREALEIVAGEPARLMRLDQNRPELERAFDCIVAPLELKPYPTPDGIANSYEIACAEWPGGTGINPMALWDLHWLKQIDDEGFIDGLIASLEAAPTQV